jgi:hypothetical protein
MSQELDALIQEVLEKDERERSISPLIKETAEILCELTDGELKDTPPADEWETWLYRDFYTSDRQRRLEILKNWDRRRHRDGVWARRHQKLLELSWMLECRGR